MTTHRNKGIPYCSLSVSMTEVLLNLLKIYYRAYKQRKSL